jgi:hypothetical protein
MYLNFASRRQIEQLCQKRGLEAGEFFSSSDELAYAITRLIDTYLRTRSDFEHHAAVIGALEVIRFELLRGKTMEMLGEQKQESMDVFSPLYWPPEEDRVSNDD